MSLPARADMFTITDIPISATSESAVSAKSLAIAEGQAAAFQKLLQRVVAPYDVQQIPQPDASALQSVVAGFSLNNERTSATQYSADLTVRFNGDAVEYLLSQYGVRLSVEQASPVLVVPVYWTGEKAIVWDDVNPWRQIWERLDLGQPPGARAAAAGRCIRRSGGCGRPWYGRKRRRWSCCAAGMALNSCWFRLSPRTGKVDALRAR